VRTSPLRRSGVDHTVLPANTLQLPLPRSSPEGATTTITRGWALNGVQTHTDTRPPSVCFCTLWPCDFDLWPRNPKIVLPVGRLFRTPSLNTLGSFVFECCCRQIHTQTDTDERFTPATVGVSNIIIIISYYTRTFVSINTNNCNNLTKKQVLTISAIPSTHKVYHCTRVKRQTSVKAHNTNERTTEKPLKSPAERSTTEILLASPIGWIHWLKWTGIENHFPLLPPFYPSPPFLSLTGVSECCKPPSGVRGKAHVPPTIMLNFMH